MIKVTNIKLTNNRNIEVREIGDNKIVLNTGFSGLRILPIATNSIKLKVIDNLKYKKDTSLYGNRTELKPYGVYVCFYDLEDEIKVYVQMEYNILIIPETNNQVTLKLFIK